MAKDTVQSIAYEVGDLVLFQDSNHWVHEVRNKTGKVTGIYHFKGSYMLKILVEDREWELTVNNRRDLLPEILFKK